MGEERNAGKNQELTAAEADADGGEQADLDEDLIQRPPVHKARRL